jgi:type I restriction enzyme M protein
MPRQKSKHANGHTPLLPEIVPDLKPTDTEVEAYEYIRQQLRDLNWIVKDPSRSPEGQVWTQNQCLAHPQMKAAFDKKRPENVVKLSEKLLWVIEAKRSRKQLDVALDEAINYYAERINALPGTVRAVLATGVAGTEESGYLMRTQIRIDGEWHAVTINKQDATGLLSPSDVRILLETNGSDVHEYAPPPWLFIHAAEHINEILHRGGLTRMIAPRPSLHFCSQ